MVIHGTLLTGMDSRCDGNNSSFDDNNRLLRNGCWLLLVVASAAAWGQEPATVLSRNPRKTAAASNAPRKEIASPFAVSGRASAAFALSADQSLASLVEGNGRYSLHKEQHPHETLARRKELEGGQHPFAVILSCSDSRVPPELVFDQGLGDLFVIRVAGNIADDDVLGSIEYAVEHLHTKLILVLGHEKCGAVSAAVEGNHDPGHLESLLSAIQPAVEETLHAPGDKIHNCVLANARHVAGQIRESEPVLKELISKEGVKVVAGWYALDSGKVNFLE